ncbi:MAG: hypothetical protein ACKPBU_12330 [Alphaproteobacteria bacterium]
MANLDLKEFETALGVLAGDAPPEKLRDRLVQLHAFHSRRGLNGLRQIAERLYALSAGLRRDGAPTRAFQALWMEFIGHRLDQEVGRELDDLADQVNSHLHDDGKVRDGEQAELEKKVAEYEDRLARRVGGQAARLDTIMKAVPAVAAFLRSRPLLDVPLDPPSEHDHDHDHVHDENCSHGKGGATA